MPAPSVIRGVGLLHLLSAVYLATAYVALCLNNPVDTLTSAGHLLPADHTRNVTDVIPPSGEPQPPDEIRTVTSSHGSTGQGHSDTATVSTSSTTAPSFGSKSSVVCGNDPLYLIAPPAYRYLARLYFAEALIMLDRAPESLSVLSCGVTRPLSDGNCLEELSTLLGSVSLAPHCLVPELHVNPGEDFPDAKAAASKEGSDPAAARRGRFGNDSFVFMDTHSSIYPIDFPSSPTQATSLHMFNLACALATNREWTMAQYYLLPSLSGLSLSAAELDGRKWSSSAGTTMNSTNPSLGTGLVTTPLVLPFPALMLQLYLFLVLGKRVEALTLLRNIFGNESLLGRVNSVHQASALVVSPTEVNGNNAIGASGESGSWTLNDLRQLLKSNGTTRSNMNPAYLGTSHNGAPAATASTGVQRPTTLWLPPVSSSSALMSSGQPVSGRPVQSTGMTYPLSHLSTTSVQPPFSNVSALNMNGRWENRTATVQPHTTGLITSANESDWPPL
ncbi:unnamed protein product [Echinostoma caproni]|uniref:CCR4-NOT transcription complex subunit 10 n=1 Tax=Echinostoma caproni TaxID=27848 RepID=A0A3P8F3R3_9TREM|nr:unnamed protein product [Echinostoma caproni]